MSPKIKTKSPQYYWGEYSMGEINYFHRQALKYAQRASEIYEYHIIAAKFPERIILGDRCMIDEEIYRQVNLDLGWITAEQKEEIGTKLNILLLKEYLDPKIIIINPPMEILSKHLEKRRKETGWEKFGEKNMKFVEGSRKRFSELKGRKRTLYIEEEFNSEDYSLIKKIGDWMLNSN